MASSGIYDEDYEVSDHESMSSPSDGYFSQREHPQGTFVEESSVQAESEAKAREAAETQANASRAAPPSQRSPTASARCPVWADESTPLLDAGPPPPDYTAATADRRNSQRQSRPATPPTQSQAARPASYGSIDRTSDSESPHGREGHQWPLGNSGNPFATGTFPFGPNGSPFGRNFPFGPSGSPFDYDVSSANPSSSAPAPGHRQSMRDTAAEASSTDGESSDEEAGLTARRRRRHKKAKWQRAGGCCKPASLLNVLFAVLAVGLILLIARFVREASKNNIGGPSDNGNHRKQPSHNGDGDHDLPDHTGHSNHTTPTHPKNSNCDFSYYSKSISFDFDHPENFAFTETLDAGKYMPGGVSGTIGIFRGLSDQDVPVRVRISLASTESWRVTDVGYELGEESLSLHFPRDVEAPVEYAGKVCMDVSVGIYMRDDVELGDWRISTANLDVGAKKNFFDGRANLETSGLWLANTTVVEADGGSVNMDYWSSRETYVKTSSGSIHGTYSLRDVLSVQSSSGSININVEPQKADPTRPAPAEFTASSSSGNVQVDFLDDDVPARDYRTKVQCHSSSISGFYLHGSATTFQTNSGTVNVDVLPYAVSESSTLHTDSGSGTLSLNILSPYDGRGTAIKSLHSSHIATSGTLSLVYPQEWEGKIDGRTTSGSLNVVGRDVKKYLDGDLGPSGKRFVGRKGYGKSMLEVRSTSGSVKLKAGDE